MNHRIITISQEFGSGGRTIGKMAAEKLGIPYYDKDLVKKVAVETGFDESYIETQGGLGIENELSEEDVAQADVVILAVSVVIEGEERFENKRVLHTDVDEAISHVEKLVDRAVALVEGN